MNVKTMLVFKLSLFVLLWSKSASSQRVTRKLGKLEEVFAWKQLTFNINGNAVTQDTFEAPAFVASIDDTAGLTSRYGYRNIISRPPSSTRTVAPTVVNNATTMPPTPYDPSSELGKFFVQYNNVPMGTERHKNRLFIAIPRRRYGIVATLNYVDLAEDASTRSPGLRPYPNYQESKDLINVYRTKVDSCNRLWMVDTGRLEIPNNQQQLRQSSLVVYDLNTDKQLFRYTLKDTDVPQEHTPIGLVSVTVEIPDGDCSNAFAYIPDLASYGIVVYSLRQNDSWRLSHNFFYLNPVYGNLNIAGQTFQWSDGIFSIALSGINKDGCRTAYFHPLASNQEFSVSTCVLRNRNASLDADYWRQFSHVGTRCETCQCTIHGYHEGTKVLFYGEIGRNSLSCWSTALPLTPTNLQILAQDSQWFSYPSDLHVTGDEVWVIVNRLPRFIYSRIDPSEFNFFIYKGSVQDLITGTACEGRKSG